MTSIASTWRLATRGALPREARDTLFLLAVIAWTVAPHLPHVPWWAGALAVVVLLWRGALALRSAPLPPRWVLVGVLAMSVAATLASHRSLLGREAGITLLVALVALKTLELRARRDAFVVFFLGFFLVLTHFLRSQSMPIAAAMLVSVWGLLAALVLAHMPVGRPPLREAALLAGRFALLGAPIMALLFVLFPRIGPLWGVPQDGGAKTGLSGEMRMGEIAELAVDESIAMRLRFTGGARPDPATLYFRGAVLGAWDGVTWRSVMPRTPRLMRVGRDLTTQGTPVDYELTVEPLQIPTLPLLELTPSLPPDAGVRALLREDLSWMTDRPIAERLRLAARAWPRYRAGPLDADAAPREYLALPPGFSPRTLAWAAELRRDPRLAEADAGTLAGALFAHIRSGGFSYTLTPGTYGEDDPRSAIDEFWLDRKAGFCEHYAAAFVVVMRALDVPARVVTGYQGAEFNAADGSYVVRQSFAHAWAEYWQPGRGWVRADPTAAVAPDRIERSRPLTAPRGVIAGAIEGFSPGLLASLRARWEAVNSAWNQWVLGFNRTQQFDLMRELGIEAPQWEDLAFALIGTVVALSLAGAGWAAWAQRRREPWLAAWDGVRRSARELDVDLRAHQTPRALARVLRARHGAAAEPAVRALLALEARRYARDARPLRRADVAPLAREARRALRALGEDAPPAAAHSRA
ncbi:transglutaminaseTgpA domain-containing protein [Caldimonas sp. KR1-144]